KSRPGFEGKDFTCKGVKRRGRHHELHANTIGKQVSLRRVRSFALVDSAYQRGCASGVASQTGARSRDPARTPGRATMICGEVFRRADRWPHLRGRCEGLRHKPDCPPMLQTLAADSSNAKRKAQFRQAIPGLAQHPLVAAGKNVAIVK